MKAKIQYTVLFLVIAILPSCSVNNAYYGAQQYQINQCLKTMSPAEYDDCIKQQDKSYEDYSRECKEIMTPQ